MTSDEIDRFLRARVRDFDGVFSIDNLPDDPHLLVCNTDPSDKPGRHWVAIYIEDGRGEFYDSFGRRPNIDFERSYMNRHCVSWKFNDKLLQSKFCGHYCIYFCIRRCGGIDMCKIMRSRISDTSKRCVGARIVYVIVFANKNRFLK